MNRSIIAVVVLLAPILLKFTHSAEPTTRGNSENPFSLVVMDPLALPLSCPCVEGYAQRRYEKLAAFLEEKLKRKVQLTFADSLRVAMKKSNGRMDLVIGKDSVVRADAQSLKRDLKPILRLTDKEGSSEQFGLIVVNKDDAAKEVKDLAGYTIVFGPMEAAEKHAAAIELLTNAGVAIPEKLTMDAACSDGACKVIELGPKSKTAAVISSYAQPLLEGCGTIKKGDLRVVGKTESVPFITAFVSKQLASHDAKAVESALMEATGEPELLDALESLVGFVSIDEPLTAKKK